MKLGLSGIFAPITAPFDASGDILIDDSKENCDKWADQGLAGLTVLGSNGLRQQQEAKWGVQR